jgi:serine phosphatase RsbU (regulator of sigma subunit)
MATPSGSHAAPTRQLLLVEDDEGDAVLVRTALEQVGMAPESITWTRTLADATAALATERTCVLLDLGLPDADGLTALLTIVENSPNTAVIVLTGRHDPGGLDALSVGAEDYLVKDDITPELLDRSIRYAVERKRAQRASQQLREARLSSAEKARLERGLLPVPLLRTGTFECSTYYQPGRDHAVLGGDFFDVVEVSDGVLRAVIGDVMGHGPDEAALGVHLRVAWRTLILAGTPEEEMLPALARLLEAETQGEPGFVTACDLTIDMSKHEVRMRVAGHPAPLRCAHGTTDYIEVEVGPPLGVDRPGAAVARERADGWPETAARLDPGSSLILYTDGLLDAYVRLSDHASLGINELVDAVAACAVDGGAVRSWIPSIVGNAPRLSLDDTAVVVLTTQGDS